VCPQPPFEVELSEISVCRSELNHTLNHLGTWMKDEHVEKNWVRGSGRWGHAGWEAGVPHAILPSAGDAAGLGLHPQGPLRGGAHHCALELPH